MPSQSATKNILVNVITSARERKSLPRIWQPLSATNNKEDGCGTAAYMCMKVLTLIAIYPQKTNGSMVYTDGHWTTINLLVSTHVLRICSRDTDHAISNKHLTIDKYIMLAL